MQMPDQEFELYSIPSFPAGRPEVLKGSDIGSNKQTVEPGMVLLSKINPRINRVWVVRAKGARQQIASTEWITFAPLSIVQPGYLAYFMRQSKFRDYLAANVSGVGGSLTRTNAAVVDRHVFPLPPLPEQRRIVARIEELFSKLDAGTAELKRTQALLKRYRQSLLHAAVTGELSRAWRAQNPVGESGAELLTRILEERRERWAQSGKKGKYREPQGPETAGLPELPEGWVWASVDQLSTHMTSGSRDWSPYYGLGDSVFIMAQNIRMGALDLGFKQLVGPPVNDPSRKRTEIARNDLLITIVGAGTGDVCRVDVELSEHYICQSAALIRLAIPSLSTWLEKYLISSEDGQRQLGNYIYGQGRPHLSFEHLKLLCVPVPPLPEQSHIVSEVERRLSILDNLEATVTAELKRAEATRQSVLHRAFTGELVAQDPADEPASVLLERIRGERAGDAGKPVGGAGKRGRPRKVADDERAGIPQASSVEEAIRVLEKRKQERAKGTRLVGLFED